MINILFIDDDRAVQNTLRLILPFQYNLIQAFTGREGMEKLTNDRVDVVLLDIDLPDFDGFHILERIKSIVDSPPVIMLTVTQKPKSIVRAIKAGAYDYIVKPYKLKELEGTIRKAIQNRELNRYHGKTTNNSDHSPFKKIIGFSTAIEKSKEIAKRYAMTDATILLQGESGTGKELFARAIHNYSNRKTGPFVAFNCGAIPDTIVESELFGTVTGAFTDAKSRAGLFESAENGTIFLDEIGELDLRTQVRLLRVLEEKSIRRVGSSKNLPVNIRIIAATNRNLREMTEKGNFREDLYYRINILSLTIPPLRERKDDIPVLAIHFLNELIKKTNTESNKETGITEEAIKKLESYTWPGNIRQLKNTIERAALLSRDKKLLSGDITF